MPAPPPAIGTPPGLYSKICKEIVDHGLKNCRDRLDEAKRCLAFYEAKFDEWSPKAVSDNYELTKNPRFSLLTQRVVDTLSGKLYADKPKRILPKYREANDWLDARYRENRVDALFHRADVLSTVASAAMFQVSSTNDPMCPVEIALWDASEFEVWFDPDRRNRPAAVALLDKYDCQRRLRLWTAELITTFLTEKMEGDQTAGGTAYRYAGEEENPFHFLPFTWVHFALPLQDFWCSSPGTFLATANEGMNQALSNNSGAIALNLWPIIKLQNVPTSYRMPDRVGPGTEIRLPPNLDSSGEADGSGPDATYLQADSSFVMASWEDFQHFLDHTLEMVGVPPSTIRMDQASLASGVRLITEQVPLIEFAKRRQQVFESYEDDLCRLVLLVGARHLGSQDYQEYRATAAQLGAAAMNPELSLRWPDLYPDIPGQDRDMHQQWLKDNRLTNLCMMAQKEFGYTEEEAEDHLKKVAEGLKKEHELFGEIDEAEAEKALMAAGKHPSQQQDGGPFGPDWEEEPEDDE